MARQRKYITRFCYVCGSTRRPNPAYDLQVLDSTKLFARRMPQHADKLGEGLRKVEEMHAQGRHDIFEVAKVMGGVKSDAITCLTILDALARSGARAQGLADGDEVVDGAIAFLKQVLELDN